jgi:tRNA threonylcarbamoyl adenosine modification protein YeaZ
MLILGIETATERVSVAVGGHEGVIGLFEVTKGRRHVETLVPAIEFVLQQAGIDLEEISVVAVDVGPGLFTGMRVGLAAAKAIALALRIPMIGISSLDLLAFPSRHTDRVVVPVVDARKGEVFYAMYRQVPGGLQQVAEPRSGRSTNSSPTCSPGARTRSVSATGRCATARRSSTASTARSAGTRIRRPHRWCSSPTLVRCARSG